MAIDVEQEITEAHARLPVALPDRELPLDIQMRAIALAVAQRHVGDTCVQEGALYQQLKMDNKLGDVVSLDHVLKAALIFERYLWGEWSKGIAENALNEVSAKIADALEEQFKNEPPIRPSGGTKSPP